MEDRRGFAEEGPMLELTYAAGGCCVVLIVLATAWVRANLADLLRNYF
jgi:hypothetical protein